ncbi:MAG: outer membrane lipoprotein carrier protein LolA [Phycisphaerales bacterium JB040]
MNTKRMALVLALVCLSGTHAAAQETGTPAEPATQPAPQAPTAESIFEKYVEAIGGREAVFALTHRKITGTYRGAPFRGGARVTLWQEAPDKSHFRLAEPLGMTYEVIYDGETAWEQTNGVAQEQSEASSRETMEVADFYGESNFRERYAEMEVLGSATLTMNDTEEKTEAWVIRVKSVNGRERRVFFAKDSGLFVAEEFQLPSDPSQTVRVVLDRYEEAGGVLYPMRQRQQVIGTQIGAEIIYREVTVEPFEHDFAPPSDLQPAPDAGDESGESPEG